MVNHEKPLCATLIVKVPFCVPLTLGVGARDDVTLDSPKYHLKKTDRCIAGGSIVKRQSPVTPYITAYCIQ